MNQRRRRKIISIRYQSKFQVLGELAAAAKGAADRAGVAIDDAMTFIQASNKRIACLLMPEYVCK